MIPSLVKLPGPCAWLFAVSAILIGLLLNLPSGRVGTARAESTWTVLAGGHTDPGQFWSPQGVAVDEQGNVYVADTRNHRIQKLSPQGDPLAMWGTPGA